MEINLANTSFILICSALVFLMTPALAFFYGGMVRRKNVLNTLLTSFFICGLASVMWVLIGYSMSFGNDFLGIIGKLNFFGLVGVGQTPNPAYSNDIPQLLFAIFQMMFAIITPALITGSLVERMKFSSIFVFIAAWSILVYYPLAHMVWGDGGFIKALGAVDFAGGNVVHISSGVAGLISCIMLGRRKGHGLISYKPHNIPFVVLGAALLWFGWFGFNSGSALNAGPLAIHAFMTTNTSAASAMLSWMLIEKIKHGKPTILGCSTGAILGLVAITPGAGFVPIWSSIIIGALVSPISFLFISKVKAKFGYDDALDAFGCHGIGGIWGGIATGLFTQTSINSSAKWNGLMFGDIHLFIAQIESILLTILISATMTYLIIKVMKLFTDIRVSELNEADGLDISEHSESAYPAFNGLD